MELISGEMSEEPDYLPLVVLTGSLFVLGGIAILTVLDPPEDKATNDVIEQTVWALQDIAIIRQMATLRPHEPAVRQVDEYLHLLHDHLLLEDLPKSGVKKKDLERISGPVKKAMDVWREYKETNLLDMGTFDGNLTFADGALCHILDKYCR